MSITMTTLKSSKDVILVNCQEVPETICVETRFITTSGKQQIIEQLISNIGSFEKSKDEQSASFMPKVVGLIPNAATNASVLQTSPANSFVSLAAPLSNLQNNKTAAIDLLRPVVATQTNNTPQLPCLKLNNAVLPIPQVGTCTAPSISNAVPSFSEQMQQTDISAFNSKSVAVQCNLDDELEDLDVEWPVKSTNFCEEYKNTEVESLFKFIEDNSTQHKNYNECLICGELCKSKKYFYGHMAVHRGPKALCFKCGQYLEHENLLRRHKCEKEKQLAKAFLKCPHFSCNVTAVSVLELYDHINEHTYSKCYKCSACRKGFCTSQEILRHILVRSKCYWNAKKKRFRFHDLQSRRDRQCRVRVFTLHTYKKCTTLVKSFLSQRAPKKGVCKICFKSIRNKFNYNHHRLICIAAFKRRLLKKDNK